MRPPKQKQPQVKKGLCRVLEHVDVDVDVFPAVVKEKLPPEIRLRPQAKGSVPPKIFSFPPKLAKCFSSLSFCL